MLYKLGEEEAAGLAGRPVKLNARQMNHENQGSSSDGELTSLSAHTGQAGLNMAAISRRIAHILCAGCKHRLISPVK